MSEWLWFGLVMAVVAATGTVCAVLWYRRTNRAIVSVFLSSISAGVVLTALGYWFDGGNYWLPLWLVFLAASAEAVIPAGITVWVLSRRGRAAGGVG